MVDVLVMHGWFTEGGMPNYSDGRISGFRRQHSHGSTGLYGTQRGSYYIHVLGEARTGVVAMLSMHCSRQTACFTGHIPTVLGHLTALKELRLSYNELTGACD